VTYYTLGSVTYYAITLGSVTYYSRVIGFWQLKCEGGASSRRALHGERAAHGLGAETGQRQADAGAGEAALGGGAVERLEDVLLLVGRDAGAVVSDGEYQRRGMRVKYFLPSTVSSVCVKASSQTMSALWTG